MDISPLVAIIPVILAAALIIVIVKRNLIERERGQPIDIAGAIPAFVILMVAVILIGGMANSAAPYSWDEDSGELTIKMSIPNQDVQPWDSYADDVKSLVIEGQCKKVPSGAFDSLTSLEYVNIKEDVQITPAAFALSFEDYMGDAVTSIAGAEYAGGDGTLYKYDPSIYRWRDEGTVVAGLTDEAASAVNLVMPNTYGGKRIVGTGYQAFYQNTSIEVFYCLPGTNLTTFGSATFSLCTSLTHADMPEGVTSIPANLFNGCTSLEAVTIPSTVTTLAAQSFSGCTGLTSIHLPEGVTSMGNSAFKNCTSLETVYIPGTMETFGTSDFQGCTAVTSVSFGSGFAATLEANTLPWTFYASDGTTALDKTVASNFAGKTFEGTAAALVEVTAGALSLTPEQIQLVHLHDQELQTMLDQPSIDPLPFQPSLQTQEQELTA